MAGIDLGSLIAGGMADKTGPAAAAATAAPPTPSREAVETAALGAPKPKLPKVEEETKTANKSAWSTYLKDPRIKAGFLQMGVNLLAGQSAGRAIGGGLAAVGRAGDTQRTQEQEDTENALKNAKAVQALAKGAGGGSGSSSVSSSKSVAKWLKMIKEALSGTDADPLAGIDVAIPGFSPFNQTKLAEISASLEGKGVDPTAMLNTAMTTDLTEAQFMASAQVYLDSKGKK